MFNNQSLIEVYLFNTYQIKESNKEDYNNQINYHLDNHRYHNYLHKLLDKIRLSQNLKDKSLKDNQELNIFLMKEQLQNMKK